MLRIYKTVNKDADELDMGTARHNQMLSSLSISSENMKILRYQEKAFRIHEVQD